MTSRDVKTSIYSLSVMISTTIGIGIFSLPYVAVKVGIMATLVYFIILGALVTIIHLMFGELALKTPDYMRLPGFAKYHLGSAAEVAIFAIIIVSAIGSMVAFASIGGEFLYDTAGAWFGGPQLLYSAIYLLCGSLLIFLGIDLVEKIEFWGLIAFFLSMAVIVFKASPFFNWNNLLANTGGWGDIFLPYGPILFSLWAASSIPEVEEMLGRKRKKKFLLPIIWISSMIALAVYLIFIVSVVGFTGVVTTESALDGFGQIFRGGLLEIVFLFGLVTTFTSFVIFGLTLKKILHYDLKISKTLSWAITAFLPLILLFAGLNNFIAIISFIGGVTLGLEGIIILMMYQKTRPDRKVLTYPLGLAMFAAVFYEIVYFFKF
jgi:tyrosine-specific transport protein